MTATQQKEALQNALASFNFPKKYFIQPADGRLGKKFALASPAEYGGVNIHSNYMKYEEFNAYLRGWYDAKMNKF